MYLLFKKLFLKKHVYILVFSVFTLVIAAQNKKGNAGSGGNTKPPEKENLNDKELTNYLLNKYSVSDGISYDDISAAKSDPEGVTSLKLRKQGLTEVPSDLSKFKNLVELDLSDNEITDFSGKLAGLPNLQILNLSGNKLTVIPTDICNLKSLKSLNLNSNLIASGSLGCLNGLERLYLSHNELTTLPAGITDIPSLKAIHLQSNKLTTLDEKLAKMPNLEVLFVQFNKIVEEPNVFRESQIINYIFSPQSTSNKALYKYAQQDLKYSILVSESPIGSQNGLIPATPFNESVLAADKKQGPWPGIKWYFASRVAFIGNSTDEMIDGDPYFEAEVGFGKSAIGAFGTDGDAADFGLYYKRHLRDLSYRLRPYAKVGLAYDIDSEGEGSAIGLMLKAGVDYYPVKFFGLFLEAGYYRNGSIAVGGILRFNAKRR